MNNPGRVIDLAKKLIETTEQSNLLYREMKVTETRGREIAKQIYDLLPEKVRTDFLFIQEINLLLRMDRGYVSIVECISIPKELNEKTDYK